MKAVRAVSGTAVPLARTDVAAATAIAGTFAAPSDLD